MAQLYFRYGAMNSSKTAQLIMTAHNYEEQGKKVLIYKPSIDTRSVKGVVESRTGIKHNCIDIDKHFDFITSLNFIKRHEEANGIIKLSDFKCILVDEAQFLTEKQVQDLAHIVLEYNIPVICYGLKNSYNGTLFEGSKALLFWADKIEEIKTVCVFCDRKATMNLRVVNGKPMYEGNAVKVGDVDTTEDYYIPTCREHYLNPLL